MSLQRHPSHLWKWARVNSWPLFSNALLSLGSQPMMPIIRDATPQDEPAARALEGRIFAALRHLYIPSSAAIAQAKQEHAQFARSIAEADGKIIGTVRWRVEDDRISLRALAVDENHRGKGIARTLVEHVLEHARKRGLRAVSAYAVAATGNVVIYERMGFTVIRESVDPTSTRPDGGPALEAYLERRLDASRPVHLRPLTRENWEECANLKVHETQAGMLPSNLHSIAAAQFYPESVPLAIYDSENRVVGFAMYGREMGTNRWKIFRLMIGAEFQRRGYGRAAMNQLIGRLRAIDDCQSIYISYQTNNEVARCLYRSLGFVEQDTTGTKVTACLILNDSHPPQS
jgi:diamine N-acetyltransferase